MKTIRQVCGDPGASGQGVIDDKWVGLKSSSILNPLVWMGEDWLEWRIEVRSVVYRKPNTTQVWKKKRGKSAGERPKGLPALRDLVHTAVGGDRKKRKKEVGGKKKQRGVGGGGFLLIKKRSSLFLGKPINL